MTEIFLGIVCGAFAAYAVSKAIEWLRNKLCNEELSKMKSEKGQALVETALVMILICFALLMALDPFILGLDTAMAKIYTYQAAREATVWMTGDSHTCYARAHGVVDGDPMLPYTTNWSLSVYPCPNDYQWNVPSHEQVVARMEFDYVPIFFPGGPWHMEVETVGIFQ